MNKRIFKTEIDTFLNEIDIRYKELTDGQLMPTFTVGKQLNEYARQFLKDEFEIVYSSGSIRFDIIFHKGNKKSLLNGTSPDVIRQLYNAILYQILANKDKYNDITREDFYFLYWGYLSKLLKNVNFTETYNTNGQIFYIRNTEGYGIFTEEIIDRAYKHIFIDKENTVKDINCNEKRINIKNKNYNTMKKISKSQIIELLDKFEQRPTIKELTEEYMKGIELINTDDIEDKDEYIRVCNDNKEKTVSTDLMRIYVKEFGLEDRIKNCIHTKEYLDKKKKD